MDEFEFAIRSVCEPIFEKPLREISFGHLLLRLFQTAQRFHMEVLPQLLLLQKTLVNIEGVGRQLYPDLDLWETARPIMKRWMSEQTGVRHLFQSTRENFPGWMEMLPQVPGAAMEVLDQMKKGHLQVRTDNESFAALTEEIKKSNQRTTHAIIAGALIIAAALLFGMHENKPLIFANMPVSVWLLSTISVIMLFRIWMKK